ncbi:BTB/POZ domain-containing protein 19-like isoform X2 [Acanthaster planci]|uniref:BTB/POZ domain-containing protein 19-like isoform X2 n=1 Tax=Acanthaster planci TaxID=133434 RepID=A0A8B7Z806_ACAPL|nr:BTB/POZ domain-containing protein 19-like isoform X2 [Acanthaster planci]
MAKERYLKGDAMPFAKQMKRLINSKDFSDIKFIVGDSRKQIRAHRCILASRCEVFRAMFADQNNKEDTPYVMSDVDPDVFLTVLEFIYTNCVALSTKNAFEVLSCSIEYGLDDLRKVCVAFLMDSLSVSSCCEVLQSAVSYGQEDLKAKALAFIDKNTQSVIKTKGFQELSAEAVCCTLQSSKLTADEPDIIAAVREWAAANSTLTRQPMQKVIQSVVRHIRLALLAPDELKQLERENEAQQIIPVTAIAAAWKFHALHESELGNPQTQLRQGTISRPSHRGLHHWDM